CQSAGTLGGSQPGIAVCACRHRYETPLYVTRSPTLYAVPACHVPLAGGGVGGGAVAVGVGVGVAVGVGVGVAVGVGVGVAVGVGVGGGLPPPPKSTSEQV